MLNLYLWGPYLLQFQELDWIYRYPLVISLLTLAGLSTWIILLILKLIRGGISSIFRLIEIVSILFKGFCSLLVAVRNSIIKIVRVFESIKSYFIRQAETPDQEEEH